MSLCESVANLKKNLNIGIVGGGMMGLATAFYLNKKGHQVTILEKEKDIGGLSRSTEILPGIHWDRFYHVILSTDTELLNFIDEIGLSLGRSVPGNQNRLLHRRSAILHEHYHGVSQIQAACHSLTNFASVPGILYTSTG